MCAVTLETTCHGHVTASTITSYSQPRLKTQIAVSFLSGYQKPPLHLKEKVPLEPESRLDIIFSVALLYQYGTNPTR